MKIKHLTIKWTVSKGRERYNIATLYDTTTRKRFRTNGGGYDMTGKVFGDWLESEYQSELLQIADKARGYWDSETFSSGNLSGNRLCGMTAQYKAGELYKIILDGACGLECMLSVAEAIGLTVQRIPDAKGNLIGFNVVEQSC